MALGNLTSRTETERDKLTKLIQLLRAIGHCGLVFSPLRTLRTRLNAYIHSSIHINPCVYINIKYIRCGRMRTTGTQVERMYSKSTMLSENEKFPSCEINSAPQSDVFVENILDDYGYFPPYPFVNFSWELSKNRSWCRKFQHQRCIEKISSFSHFSFILHYDWSLHFSKRVSYLYDINFWDDQMFTLFFGPSP